MKANVPPNVELRRSNKYAVGIFVLILAACGLITSPMGILGLVLWLISLGLALASWPAFLRHIAKRPPRMIINGEGLHFGDTEQRTVISWQEIQDVELFRARNGIFLGINVRHPEIFLRSFRRVSLLFLRFHFVVRIGELDRSPRQVMDAIHESWRFYSIKGRSGDPAPVSRTPG